MNVGGNRAPLVPFTAMAELYHKMHSLTFPQAPTPLASEWNTFFVCDNRRKHTFSSIILVFTDILYEGGRGSKTSERGVGLEFPVGAVRLVRRHRDWGFIRYLFSFFDSIFAYLEKDF